MELRIDPVTSYLIEYRYMDEGSPWVFSLADGEYIERAPQKQGP